MKIYGLTISNLFAAIVVGLVLSFLLISVLAPVNSVNEIKKENPQPVIDKNTPQSNDGMTNDLADLGLTLLKIMILVVIASVVFALLSMTMMRPY
jgi:hypothetical protein